MKSIKKVGHDMREYPHTTTYVDELTEGQLRESIELAMAKPEPTKPVSREELFARVKARAKARIASEQVQAAINK